MTHSTQDQSQPIKFSELYNRIASHLEHHPEIVIIGKKTEEGTYSNFTIDYYVAPHQEIVELDKLNRLLQSLQPEGLTPSDTLEFKFATTISKEAISLGAIGYKMSIGEKRLMKKLDCSARALDTTIHSIDEGSLIETSQYTAGFRIRLFPSKGYADEVLKGLRDHPYGTFLNLCFLDGERLILPHEYDAYVAQRRQQDKSATKGVVRRIIDYFK